MAERVKARRLSDDEGQWLLRIVRRGEPKTTKSVIRYRRAMGVLASASGNTVPAIARLVATDEDTDQEVIHSSGRLGQPFTRWSLRKLGRYLADNPRRIVRIGRERARRLLAAHEISFQRRTKTWKESHDPQREAKLARIEEVIEQHPDRTFAFDEFGPLTIQPIGGAGWAPRGKPHRLPANYHKTAGVRSFHGCYLVGEDRLWGVVRAGKSAANTRAALRSLRAAPQRAAQRRERARVRSERHRRWGQPKQRAAA
jgi:hypothetical protein